MSEVIDTLAIEIAANDSFTAVAKPLLSLLERLEEAVNKNTEALGDYEKATEGTAKSTEKVNAAQDKSEKSTKKSTKALQDQEKQVKKNEKAAKNLLQAIGGFTKAIGALGTMIFAGVGLDRLAQEAAKTNKELDVTSKNLGMTSQSLATWRGAAELSGGSAQGLTGYLNNLSAGLTRLTVQGDTSVTQFFNALGINLLDGSQKAKKLEDIMLELADKFSKMDRVKAFGIAQQMGIDEGTFEMLAQGRQGLEEHLQKTAKIYKSNQQDLETARKLTAATSYLNQQFEGLKLMIANAAMPVLLKIADVTNAFFEYLQKNENLVKGVFWGIAGAISIALIPTLIRGASAALAFIAPFLPMILIVIGLAAAFGLLYEDYEKWANGGTSLFNWEVFTKWFEDADFSVQNLMDGFANLVGGYKDWAELASDAGSWLRLKGFIKDNRISVDSLAEGFKNLGKDIVEYLMPVFDRLLGVLLKIIRLDFEGAWDEVKSLGSDAVDWVDKTATDAWNGFTNWWNGVEERVPAALDKAAGIEPQKGENSLSNPENKLMDSKQGFKKSGSKAGIAEQTLLDEMNKLGYSEQEQAMFLATVQHESNDFKQLREIGGYKSVEQMQKANIARAIQDPEGARRAIAQGVDAQFEFMYGGRMGNDQKGDGAKYRGRGAIQITGKDNYRRIGNQMGIDLVNNPELLETNPEIAAKASIVWWENKKKESQKFRNAIATGDFKSVTKGVNNGLNGWDDRVVRYNRIQSSGMFAKTSIKNKPPQIDPNRPLGGYAVANALNANQHTFAAMQNLAQPQNINNNQKTEVAFNGGIHINSTAGTLSGTALDLVNGVQNRVNVMQFNTGLS